LYSHSRQCVRILYWPAGAEVRIISGLGAPASFYW